MTKVSPAAFPSSRATASRHHHSNDDAWELLDRARVSGYSRDFAGKLRIVADKGNCSALNVLAMLHRDGLRDARGKILIQPDSRLALRYEKRAAQLGDPDSMTAIADRLARHGGRVTMLRAAGLYHRAFHRGCETAAYNLAYAYQRRGQYRAAVGWFRKALAAGDSSALLPLGRAELYGIGTKRDVPAALSRLRQLARSKDTYWPPNWLQCEAMRMIANVLIEGWLVRRDRSEGLRWLRRAAKLGSGAAKADLESHRAI